MGVSCRRRWVSVGSRRPAARAAVLLPLPQLVTIPRRGASRRAGSRLHFRSGRHVRSGRRSRPAGAGRKRTALRPGAQSSLRPPARPCPLFFGPFSSGAAVPQAGALGRVGGGIGSRFPLTRPKISAIVNPSTGDISASNGRARGGHVRSLLIPGGGSRMPAAFRFPSEINEGAAAARRRRSTGQPGPPGTGSGVDRPAAGRRGDPATAGQAEETPRGGVRP